jgi:hypothetical protein
MKLFNRFCMCSSCFNSNAASYALREALEAPLGGGPLLIICKLLPPSLIAIYKAFWKLFIKWARLNLNIGDISCIYIITKYIKEALRAAEEYTSHVFLIAIDVCSIIFSFEEMSYSIVLDSFNVLIKTSSPRRTLVSCLSNSKMAFSISLRVLVCSNAYLEFSINLSSSSFLSVPIIIVKSCWCRDSMVIWKLIIIEMFCMSTLK